MPDLPPLPIDTAELESNAADEALAQAEADYERCELVYEESYALTAGKRDEKDAIEATTGTPLYRARHVLMEAHERMLKARAQARIKGRRWWRLSRT